MTNKQQTAVQWLKEKLAVTYSPADIEWLWFKALEMEKKQMIDIYEHGEYNGYMYRDGNSNIITSEQYFTDTYQTEL